MVFRGVEAGRAVLEAPAVGEEVAGVVGGVWRDGCVGEG